MTKLLWAMLPPLLLTACNKSAPPAGNAVAPDGMNDMMAANMAATNMTGNAMMPPPPESAGGVVTEAPAYLAKAGAGDLFEIESSKAVLAKTTDANLKRFAQMMIDDHGKSTQKLKDAAREAGLTVAPPALDPAQQQMLDRIKAASGTAAVQAYLDAQRTAHQQALALHRGYASRGNVPQLKTAATDIAAVVQHHIDMLSALNAR